MKKQRNIVLFTATSLDGYIAAKDESLEWLFKVEGEGDNGFSAFYETIDTILMGRKTYDWIINHTNDFSYKNKECYVFSRQENKDTDEVTFIKDDIIEFANKLKKQEGKNIWMVGGGELLHSFLKEKLIDEFILTIAPAIIGEGVPLFKEADYQVDLILKGTKCFNQFVEVHYERRR